MQLAPGDPCLWGSLQVKLKTEHVVAGQKVLEALSQHTKTPAPVYGPSSVPAWGAQEGAAGRELLWISSLCPFAH